MHFCRPLLPPRSYNHDQNWYIFFIIADFILGEDFDGSLGVGSSYGINVGGASALDAPDSEGVRGCTGKLLISPPFKKGDIE